MLKDGWKYHALATITDVFVETSGDNPYDEVMGGFLCLRANLIDMEVVEIDYLRWGGRQKILVDGEQTKLFLRMDESLRHLPARLICVPLQVISGEELQVIRLALEKISENEELYRRVGRLGLAMGFLFAPEDYRNDSPLKWFGVMTWNEEYVYVGLPLERDWTEIRII